MSLVAEARTRATIGPDEGRKYFFKLQIYFKGRHIVKKGCYRYWLLLNPTSETMKKLLQGIAIFTFFFLGFKKIFFTLTKNICFKFLHHRYLLNITLKRKFSAFLFPISLFRISKLRRHTLNNLLKIFWFL